MGFFVEGVTSGQKQLQYMHGLSPDDLIASVRINRPCLYANHLGAQKIGQNPDNHTVRRGRLQSGRARYFIYIFMDRMRQLRIDFA